ncbi:MAG: hypothetical protein KGQ46_05220 [Hyphomicrobiales bacterium]|nr:hypothetical protein [Hyphomicrobiales bacterium]MDE2113486.1 hypothetical protein [Hyphomicrobiales bacterium]
MVILDGIYSLFTILYNVVDYGRGILFEGDVYAGEIFILLTLVLGGAGAYAAGKAVAGSWKSIWLTFAYCLPLAAAVRFLHYALYDETLFSAQYYIVTLVILCLIAALGFRKMRAEQMTRQYSWIYNKSGSLQWRDVG